MRPRLAAVLIFLGACDSASHTVPSPVASTTATAALTANSKPSPKLCATSADCPAPQSCESVVLLRRTERVCVPQKRLRLGSSPRRVSIATTDDATDTQLIGE